MIFPRNIELPPWFSQMFISTKAGIGALKYAGRHRCPILEKNTSRRTD